MIMVMLNIDMPASCEDCPYKGARWCYLEVLRKKEPKEVPEEGRAEDKSLLHRLITSIFGGDK